MHACIMQSSGQAGKQARNDGYMMTHGTGLCYLCCIVPDVLKELAEKPSPIILVLGWPCT